MKKSVCSISETTGKSGKSNGVKSCDLDRIFDDEQWDPLINSLEIFSEDFMEERNQPGEQIRESW